MGEAKGHAYPAVGAAVSVHVQDKRLRIIRVRKIDQQPFRAR